MTIVNGAVLVSFLVAALTIIFAVSRVQSLDKPSESELSTAHQRAQTFLQAGIVILLAILIVVIAAR